MRKSDVVVLFVVGLTGCTRWGTTEVYGPDREVARHLLGAPAVAESKSATLGVGFAGAGGGGIAVAGLGASGGSISIKHCVQQAELTFEQSYELEPELQGRGGDLGLAIPMGAVGALAIANSATQVSRDEFTGEEISPTPGYVVGGALITAGVAILVRSFIMVPNNRPEAAPATTRRRIETRLVEATGCGLPGDVAQLTPAVPVLSQPQAKATPDASARIQQLDKLRASGTISEAEYARKRQKIVDDI